MHIDTADAGCTAGVRTLLDQLDDSEVLSLGVLSGAELCVLGGTEHPVCWGPLKSAWRELGQLERERLADTSTQGMFRRGLVKDQPPGRGVKALFFPACYKVSAELGILLGARKSPALIIATHHESRTPAVTYFQLRGTTAIVEEVPDRADNGIAGAARSSLDVIFSYRLLTRAFAVGELARWALKPVVSARHQPIPPRLIGLFGWTEGDTPPSCQLTIYGNGERAHVYGPDISADLSSQELIRFMTDLLIKWADNRNSVAGIYAAQRSSCDKGTTSGRAGPP